jgi:hypothetical protein
MKGQYRPDNPTLLPGELFIPVLDGYGRIIVTMEGGGGGGPSSDVNITGGTLDTLTSITDPVEVNNVQSIINAVDIIPPTPGIAGSSLTTSMFHGAKTVPTGTAESLGIATSGITGILVTARSSNSVPVYLGGDNTVTTSTGTELLPGASVKLAVVNVSQIFCISGTASQVLNFLVQ